MATTTPQTSPPARPAGVGPARHRWRLRFPAAADAYPGKDAVADYLAAHAAEFGLPVRLDTRVTSLTRAGDGSYVVKAGADAVEAVRGITPSPGLHTLGRTWQHTRGSALLGWVGDDAAYLAEHIAARAA
jgi:hypothetical protein